jgi:hypothetical protein
MTRRDRSVYVSRGRDRSISSGAKISIHLENPKPLGLRRKEAMTYI